MQEVTDVEVLPLQPAVQKELRFRRRDLQENRATQPVKAQSKTQLERAQQSVHTENPTVLRNLQEGLLAETSLKSHNLQAREIYRDTTRRVRQKQLLQHLKLQMTESA